MMCSVCKHGETESREISVTLERDGTTVVIRSVPAQVCTNCGEQYVDAEITARVLRQAELAAEQGVQVEIRKYVAA